MLQKCLASSFSFQTMYEWSCRVQSVPAAFELDFSGSLQYPAANRTSVSRGPATVEGVRITAPDDVISLIDWPVTSTASRNDANACRTDKSMASPGGFGHFALGAGAAIGA